MNYSIEKLHNSTLHALPMSDGREFLLALYGRTTVQLSPEDAKRLRDRLTDFLDGQAKPKPTFMEAKGFKVGDKVKRGQGDARVHVITSDEKEDHYRYGPQAIAMLQPENGEDPCDAFVNQLTKYQPTPMESAGLSVGDVVSRTSAVSGRLQVGVVTGPGRYEDTVVQVDWQINGHKNGSAYISQLTKVEGVVAA